VLNLPRVGLHDNFFEIGGESLLGLRVLNRLRDLLSEDISLAVIFEAPTVEKLAAVLEKDYGKAIAANDADAERAEAKPAARIPRLSRAR